MKILPVDKIREADAYTIAHEPIADIDLMERAAGELFNWISKKVDTTHRFFVVAGLGNNGGDGLALARILKNFGYEVKVFVVRYSEKTADNFTVNYKRFNDLNGEFLFDVKGTTDFPETTKDDILVDALFGSGLGRPVQGFLADITKAINKSPALKIAIDIPSGLFADKTSIHLGGEIVRVDYTLTFQNPKLAFLLPENDPFVGRWIVLDIGLHPDYLKKVQIKNFYVLKEDVVGVLKPRTKFSHKGTYGHALLIAGSYGKMGAAILAAKAALRSGLGLLHVHIPKSGYLILQSALPEAMLSIDRYENYFSDIPDLSPYNAVGVGPGLGMEHQSQMALKLLIQNFQHPIVFDADALNILAKNKTWLSFLPPNSILTPHPKEFERLVGKWNNDFEKIEMQRHFVSKYNVIVVLKGACTSICLPSGKCYFNSTGNPGMATAGSGDVLTGILTGLLTQGCSPEQAAVLGVYLHGLSGDVAAKKLGQRSVIAGDIIGSLGKAFRKLERLR